MQCTQILIALYNESIISSARFESNMVTGDREVSSVLTIHSADENGNMRWELADGANLYDVTHLGCRSARYQPQLGSNACSPAVAPEDAFRVAPGAEMPPVEGCLKQDYAVLFVIGVVI